MEVYLIKERWKEIYIKAKLKTDRVIFDKDSISLRVYLSIYVYKRYKKDFKWLYQNETLGMTNFLSTSLFIILSPFIYSFCSIPSSSYSTGFLPHNSPTKQINISISYYYYYSYRNGYYLFVYSIYSSSTLVFTFNFQF